MTINYNKKTKTQIIIPTHHKMQRKAASGFVPPSQERRTKALGDMTCECEATKKAL